jgi:RNA recognition motif-containing protein
MNLDNTLWMGGILPGMTESQIMDSFKFFNVFPINIKFIRDKKKNKNKSFCFVTFKSFEDANNVLHYLNGKKIPNTEIIFRLNWADYQGSNKTVYVGGLHPNVTKDDLISFFRLQYKSVYNARIILDENGMSRGFGFVVFKSEEDYYKCLKEMNGVYFYGNFIKVNEQIKKEDENTNKKMKGNIMNNLRNVNNNIYIKNNNMININNITNINDIMIQNNIINNTNNINYYNQNECVINDNDNFRNINNNKMMEYNPIDNIQIQNLYSNNNIMDFRNSCDTNFNNGKKNINNFDFKRIQDKIINKNNSSYFFYDIKNNKQNTTAKNIENVSLINETKNNKNNIIQPKIQNNLIIKESDKKTILKKENKERRKIKLEVLEKIDEVTLYRKIHESILRTFSYTKMLLSKNGINFKCKFIYNNIY